jgi:hypothetical protein
VPNWKNVKMSIRKFHFVKVKISFISDKLVEVKICFIFGRPKGRVSGRGLAQLSNKKFSVINGSLQLIWMPPGGGLGGGDLPN